MDLKVNLNRIWLFRPSKLLNSSESTSSIDSNEPKASQTDHSMSAKIADAGPPNKLVKR